MRFTCRNWNDGIKECDTYYGWGGFCAARNRSVLPRKDAGWLWRWTLPPSGACCHDWAQERAERSFVEDVVVRMRTAYRLRSMSLEAPLACLMGARLLDDDFSTLPLSDGFVTEHGADIIHASLPMRVAEALVIHELPVWQELEPTRHAEQGGFTDKLRNMVQRLKTEANEAESMPAPATATESECSAFLVGRYGKFSEGGRWTLDDEKQVSGQARDIPQHEKKSCFADYQYCVRYLRELKDWPVPY